MGLSTLETLARPHQHAGRIVCPVLDARNRRVFSSGYFENERVIPEQNRTIEDLLERITGVLSGIKGEGTELVFCGDAASIFRMDAVVQEKLRPLLGSGLLSRVLFLDTVPQAADAAVLAYGIFCRTDREMFDPFGLEASYLSPSQAERMKKPGRNTSEKEIG